MYCLDSKLNRIECYAIAIKLILFNVSVELIVLNIFDRQVEYLFNDVF